MNLSSLNPWWVSREEINNDGKIVDLQRKRYQYIPPLLKREYKPGNIYSIRGPRQLGKTTVLKLLIRDLLLKKGTEPYAVFFWSCEDIVDFQQLVQLIQEYKEVADEKGIVENYIFLDEISFVREWQRGIKLLVDRGYLRDSCVILSGSNVMDIRSSVERLPGRRGREGVDFTLLPLAFYEFCELLGFCPDVESITDLKAIDGRLKLLFRKYLETGGFPLVINELLGENKDPTWLKEIYYSWIIGDLLRSGRSEKVALQIISSLVRRQPSALSWDSLAKDAEVKSHLTISSYMGVLEEMFVLKISYFYNREKRRADPNKNKKIHFLDNYIYRLFCTNTRQEPKREVMYEDMVCFHLCKQMSEVYYVSGKRELDFLFSIGNLEIGVEVKCQNKVRTEDYMPLHPVKLGFLVNPAEFNVKRTATGVYYALPMHWFLYLRVEELLRLFGQ